ncbi:MAG: hypothetical protein GX162_06510 [Firmicutes bacterium]|jgi:hypothetical protein|nr:hypothetical protein [Bacillota bacterium]
MLAVVADLARSVWPQGHVVTFDAAFVHREPLQISDLRSTLGNARHALANNDWPTAIRLIRDGRNQWSVFRAQIPKLYKEHSWDELSLHRGDALWNDAVRYAELRSLSKTLRALERLQSVFDTQRSRYIPASAA